MSKQMSSIERPCWKNAQYPGQECVEIMGLLQSIEDKELEPTVCRMLQYIGVDVTGEMIEARHRLNNQSDRTIVKFLRRKDCEHVMRKKAN